MLFKFCIIIESNSQKHFLTIVLYTNMVTVTSRENETLDSKLTRTLILLLFFCHEKVYAKDDRILPFEKALSFSAVKTQYTDFGLSGTMQFYLFYFIRSEINAIF